MGASVSSGAHSGLVGVWCSTKDELLPLLVLDSIGLEPEEDDGRGESVDPLTPVGDSAQSFVCEVVLTPLVSSGSETILDL